MAFQTRCTGNISRPKVSVNFYTPLMRDRMMSSYLYLANLYILALFLNLYFLGNEPDNASQTIRADKQDLQTYNAQSIYANQAQEKPKFFTGANSRKILRYTYHLALSKVLVSKVTNLSSKLLGKRECPLRKVDTSRMVSDQALQASRWITTRTFSKA